MDTDGGRVANTSDDPTRLRYVGPATAAVIERAPFDAADIEHRRVSHRLLIQSGVNPGVAERLRWEYGLLWSFRWFPGGEDLPRRAAKLPGLSLNEREWIAASANGWDGRLPDVGRLDGQRTAASEPEVEMADWPDWPQIGGPVADASGFDAARGDPTDTPSNCPRCGGELNRYELGERQSIQCDGCGYVGVEIASDTAPWQRAVERVFGMEPDGPIEGRGGPEPEGGTRLITALE